MCTKRPCKCSCDLVRVAPGDDGYEAVMTGPMGAFYIGECRDGEVVYPQLCVKLPNEGGDYHALPLYLESQPHPPGRPAWKWDGNREKPTLSPSIRTRHLKRDVEHDGPYGDADMEESWHGHIKAGRAESCA